MEKALSCTPKIINNKNISIKDKYKIIKSMDLERFTIEMVI